jgi:glycogen phosphorylase
MTEPHDLPCPDRIHRLGELARDLWWAWHEEGRHVFRLLDHSLWRSTAHNPVLLLRLVRPDVLAAAAADPAFLAAYDAAIARRDANLGDGDTWWSTRFPDTPRRPIAYFSAEFAVHQSLPIYAGGLGALAGDHCKEAADLGVPLIAVGFMYPQGYFHQRMSAEGWQEESYRTLNWADAPIAPATTREGERCRIAVPLGDREVWTQAWEVRLGRVRILLLDTDLDDNAPNDRELSARLYGGTKETRLLQEIVLGVGGVRTLRRMGIDPMAWHLNEGHAAFVALERLREAVEGGQPFAGALAAVRATTVFTTHTPVPAGHDAFPAAMVSAHLASFWAGLAAHREDALALGLHDDSSGPLFNMTALALRTASRVNGVSQRHGEVTREMWGGVRGAGAADDTPITSITNGVHVASWVASRMVKLFERWIGVDWYERHDESALWDRILEVPDEELWVARQALRAYLCSYMRERARRLWSAGDVSASRVAAAGVLLDPEALTIGYARRFTAYKRPELIFHDEERLARLLASRRYPVQIVFAGKSHPADHAGKEHLFRVFSRAIDPRFGGRIAFVEDYDLHVAHYLVQGCDVWLNTPRAPLEASGTSGMKAAVNGVPHLSVDDGWWAEGCTGGNGWLIDATADRTDADAADAADAATLYRLIEESVVPTFYDRDARGISKRWLLIVKEAIRTTAPRFSARRMVKEYAAQMYAPAAAGSTRGRQGRDHG